MYRGNHLINLKMNDFERQKMNDLKKYLCVFFERDVCRRGADIRQAAIDAQISEEYMSKIFNKRVDDLSLHYLFLCLIRVRPNFQILLSA